MYVDPRGQASRNQTGIHDDRVVPSLRRATGAVHEAGGLIFAQLGHCGSQTMMSSITPVAPSPVPNAMYAHRPEGLSQAGIEALVRSFGDAARRAREAGFDGVHIHGGNGYLISEFCSPHANTREDGWGGNAERRSRFFVEVYEAVRAAVGTGFPVTARLSVEDSVPGGLQREESLQRARLLAERGIDGFETTFGVMRSYFENIRPYVAVGRRQAWRQMVAQRCWNPEGPEAYYRPLRPGRPPRRRRADDPGGRSADHRNHDRRPGLRRRRLRGHGPPVHPRTPTWYASSRPGRTGGVECVSCNMCLAHDGWDPLQCWPRHPRKRHPPYPQALLDQPPATRSRKQFPSSTPCGAPQVNATVPFRQAATS